MKKKIKEWWWGLWWETRQEIEIFGGMFLYMVLPLIIIVILYETNSLPWARSAQVAPTSTAVFHDQLFKMDIKKILASPLTNKAALAEKMYPEAKDARSRLNNKLKGNIGQRMTDKDYQLAEAAIREEFGL